MLEMVVFAVTLAVSNVAATFIVLKMVMSKRFLKKYMDTINDMVTLGMDDDED